METRKDFNVRVIMHTMVAPELARRLSASGFPLAERAALVSRTRGNDELKYVEQITSGWGRLLRVKYGMAREKGYEVVGLESLITLLDACKSPKLAGLVLDYPTGFFLIVLPEDLAQVIGLLEVRNREAQIVGGW